MEELNELFLEALKASLEDRKVNRQIKLSEQEIVSLFRISEVHHVLPMIYEAVYNLPSVQQSDPGVLMPFKRNVIQLVAVQAMKTGEFRQLYEYLRQGGITPCVVKGLICRNLYPNPDARMSGDEDIFIPENQFDQAHKLLLDYGMTLSDPDEDIDAAYEVSYGKAGSPIYIELHKSLFSTDSEAYGDLNRYFEGAHDRLVEEEIDGTGYLTMCPTDHLLYLICHSFKHFLHSGFGIRQVCDIILYVNAHGSEIDWQYVLDSCREIRADLFAASIFKIGEKYLTFNSEKSCYPEEWQKIAVDETDMLNDLLASGVYGQADMSRKHSSNITLNAVIADKRGQKAKAGVLSSVFLPLKSMEGRFPYLKKYPFFLPVAWVQRVWIYRKETAAAKTGNNAAESIRIGNQRVELMKKYGIIK